MDWQSIKESRIIRRFRNHWLYLLLPPLFWWIMSNFLTTPSISAVVIVFMGYIVLTISLDSWIKAKTRSWFESKICSYCIIYFGLLIICVLIALPFWDTLVYWCDRNNPYKQPLATGTAETQIIIDSNEGDIVRLLKGHIILVKGQDIFLKMWPSDAVEGKQLGNNNRRFRTTFKLDKIDKAIGKPIYSLAKAELVVIRLDSIPPSSKIIGGFVIFTFNSSVRIKIPIPSQTMEGDAIVIREIQKCFKGY